MAYAFANSPFGWSKHVVVGRSSELGHVGTLSLGIRNNPTRSEVPEALPSGLMSTRYGNSLVTALAGGYGPDLGENQTLTSIDQAIAHPFDRLKLPDGHSGPSLELSVRMALVREFGERRKISRRP